jgi:hypothetical protein
MTLASSILCYEDSYLLFSGLVVHPAFEISTVAFSH